MSSKIESAPVISQSAGPDRGFGRLWRKIYSIALSEVDIQPEDLISNWKEHFGDFWPGENTFNAPIRGLKPGEMAGVELEMPGRCGDVDRGATGLLRTNPILACCSSRSHILRVDERSRPKSWTA